MTQQGVGCCHEIPGVADTLGPRGCPQGLGKLLELRRTCMENIFENKVG